jgi:hypothetical protein
MVISEQNIGKVLYMIDKKNTDKILDFIRQKPRTIQEVAHLLEKNWRTAERYVDTIATETGMVATRTFREGTRGALKIVFWNAIDGGKGSAYQERLLHRIELAKGKNDFSPFDIYQFVPQDKREAFLQDTEFSTAKRIKYDDLLSSTQHQLLLFSGNLSWVELGPRMMKVLENLAKKNVSIKILTRVDITSEKNTRAMLDINHRVGWDAVEIRHCEQPLRAAIIDDDLASIKEVLSPAMIRELKTTKYIFYRISDVSWVNWLQKLFWHLWAPSVDAKTRLDALKTLR